MNTRLRRSKAPPKGPNPTGSKPLVPIGRIDYQLESVVRESTILSYSHDSGRMHAVEGKNKFQAADENVAVVSIGSMPVNVFLRSFREHGSEFVSSAYL